MTKRKKYDKGNPNPVATPYIVPTEQDFLDNQSKTFLDPNYRDPSVVDLASVSSMNSKVRKKPFSGLNLNNFVQGVNYALPAVDAFLSYNEERRNDEAMWTNMQRIFNQKPIYDANYIHGPGTNQGSQYQGIISAEEGAEISPVDFPVELEGEEFILLPNGETEVVKGPKHNKGGVITNLPQGSWVFSNRLKSGKKTFAELAKDNDTKRETDILKDPFSDAISRNTAGLMLPRKRNNLRKLFEEQQTLNGNSKGEKMDKGGLPDVRGIYAYPSGGTVNFDDPSQLYKLSLPGSSILEPQTVVQSPQVATVEGDTTTGRSGDPVADLRRLFQNNPQLKADFYKRYKQRFPNTKGSVDDILNSFETVERHVQELNKKIPVEEIRAAELDRGLDNKNYDALAKKYGFTPVAKNEVGRFQAAYNVLAELKSDPQYQNTLSDFDINPIGVPDQVYGKPNYQGKPISPDDFRMGNTSLGQLVKYSESPLDPGVKSPVQGAPKAEAPRPPFPGDINFKSPTFQNTETPSTMGKFPYYQALPEVAGFIGAMNTYPYYTPDFTHQEISPPTLNIDPQISSINSGFQSLVRANTGNPSVQNARNTAAFIARNEALQTAFATKQNYDADGRFKADSFNINARNQEQSMDISAAANVYNEYRAAAKDYAASERLGALTSLSSKYGNYLQDEYRKVAYFDTMLPNYFYNGLDRRNPVKQEVGYTPDLTPEALDYLKAITK